MSFIPLQLIQKPSSFSFAPSMFLKLVVWAGVEQIALPSVSLFKTANTKRIDIIALKLFRCSDNIVRSIERQYAGYGAGAKQKEN